ncbi:MAG: YkgJ family cysteine cluster protein [Sulfurimonas sp.]|nr:YkgJ family cysteine cluster protein [Sulfurimonas sp.]
MSTIIKQNGFTYKFDANACFMCQGRCCTGESGYIYVTKVEIENISELLGLDIKDFMQQYLFKKGYKYFLKENQFSNNFECIFYDREVNGCKIYDARSLQCKKFHFWDYFKSRVNELKIECPGAIDV